MGVGELLLGLVVCLSALVAGIAPVAALLRTREIRFVLVTGANLALLAIGVLAVYANVVPRAPPFTHVEMLPLSLVAFASVLLLGTGMVPRGR